MLFNSYEFIFFFLPVCVAGFFLAARFAGRMAALGWLVFASFVFYGWMTPEFTLLLGASIVFNFFLGKYLIRTQSGLALATGIAVNLGVLGYYKYSTFFFDTISAATGTSFFFETVALPLAISFFTFQQIAYLVDSRRRQVDESGFLKYALFVTFFPQLIIGPIVHHSETIPQFGNDSTFKARAEDFSVGLTIFTIGLFKKVVIADTIATFVDPAFAAASTDKGPGMAVAWVATIGFCLQLYFDFSSYSDMAIGLARIFGIKLPINFDSPLKQTTFSALWRHWHMTLFRFFRDYLFMPLLFREYRHGPLAGKRPGPLRLPTTIMIVMVLSGVWHGAGWNFFLMGALFGGWILLEMAWQRWLGVPFAAIRKTRPWHHVAKLLTFLAFCSGMPFFRAPDFSSASKVYQGLIGLNSDGQSTVKIQAGDSSGAALLSSLLPDSLAVALILVGAMICVWALPNSQEFMRRYEPALTGQIREPSSMAWLVWQPNWRWGAFFGFLAGLLLMGLSNAREFVYFQF